ncbi:hypothetical protein [Massilia consociata]|uniref:Uncharacterized protein n=1 Tax=Massilia consociata TaxID=760117 RepID=A0ABV6FHU1_9BURK
MRRAQSRIASRSRLSAPLAALAALRATGFWRHARALVAAMRRGVRTSLRHAGRQPGHLMRVLRRMGARLRTRQRQAQDKPDTEHQ